MENSVLDEMSNDYICPLQDDVDLFLSTRIQSDIIPSLQVKWTPTQQIEWPSQDTLCNSSTPVFTQLSSFQSEYHSGSRIHELQCIMNTPTRQVSRNHSNAQHYVSSEDLATNPQEFFLIDCRWPYEYAGGTIRGAVNIYTGEDLKKSLLHVERPITDKNILFFCEFSQCRSVRMSQFLIKVDRRYHGDFVYYNNVFILEGGFNKCYQNQKHLIHGNYIHEDDQFYSDQRDHYSKNGSYKLIDTPEDDLPSLQFT